MAYDAELADRLRAVLSCENGRSETNGRSEANGLSEKRMFGGLAFLLDGHLTVSASSRGGLLLRVDPHQVRELVGSAGVERFVMRGRELDGWLHVSADAVASEDELRRWVGLGLAYTRTLPARG